MRCLDAKEAARYREGDLRETEAAAVAAHVAGCDRCAQLLGELDAITDRLRPDTDEFADPAFADEVMTLVRLGRAEPAAPPAPRWRLWAPVGAVAALGLIALLVVPTFLPRPTSLPGDDDGFAARGDAPDGDAAVVLTPYRATPDGFAPVTDTIAADDALAFAYEDRSASPHPWLMVFAVDARGEVFWYEPAWIDEDERPNSVPTRTGRVALPDQVRHALVPGPLRLFAVFSRAPLDVGTVERRIARQLAAAGSLAGVERLALDETAQHVVPLTVRPARRNGAAP